MAKAQNPPGPRQIFKDLIDRVAFPPTLGGQVFIYYNYAAGMIDPDKGKLTSPPPAAGAVVVWTDLLEGKLPNVDLTLSFPFSVKIAGQTPPFPAITNPQTKEMVSHYSMWKFQEPKHVTGSSPGTTGTIYVIDTASWQLIYDHFLEGRITPPMSRDQAIALFQSFAGHDPSGLITDPSKVEVQLEQAFINGVFQDIPNFPDPITFRIFAEAGWTYHTEVGSGSNQLYGRRDAGSLVINLLPIRNLLPSDNQGRKPDSFEFVVQYDGAGGAIDSAMQLGLYVKGKNKDETNDYPVIADTAKINTSFDAGISHALPSGGSATIKVTFAKKDPDTGVITPPSVEIINDTGADGGHSIG